MCSSAVTSDRSVICSSELSVICSPEIKSSLPIHSVTSHGRDGCHRSGSAIPIVPHSSARARQKGGCPTGRHASRQPVAAEKSSRLNEFIPYSARCPVGSGEVRHSPLEAPQLRA